MEPEEIIMRLYKTNQTTRMEEERPTRVRRLNICRLSRGRLSNSSPFALLVTMDCFLDADNED
jgi:hypothetical protein